MHQRAKVPPKPKPNHPLGWQLHSRAAGRAPSHPFLETTCRNFLYFSSKLFCVFSCQHVWRPTVLFVATLYWSITAALCLVLQTGGRGSVLQPVERGRGVVASCAESDWSCSFQWPDVPTLSFPFFFFKGLTPFFSASLLWLTTFSITPAPTTVTRKPYQPSWSACIASIFLPFLEKSELTFGADEN